MASKPFDSYLDDVYNSNINVSTDTFKVLLVNGYTPNFGTHTKRSDVTGEVTGTGYTAGGNTVAATISKDTTNHRNDVAFAATSWTTATISATGAVYYKSRGGLASADELVAYDDFGGTITSTGGTFSLPASTVRVQW